MTYKVVYCGAFPSLVIPVTYTVICCGAFQVTYTVVYCGAFPRNLHSGILWGFPSRVIPMTYTVALCWLPSQAPGVIGSALDVAVPVSVNGDWVR